MSDTSRSSAQEWRDSWLRMFRDEWFLRVGYEWDEMSPADTFFQFYGLTPHEAVINQIAKYALHDLTTGKTVWFVISDEDGAYLMENDPGENMVLWIGDRQFDAEVALASACE